MTKRMVLSAAFISICFLCADVQGQTAMVSGFADVTVCDVPGTSEVWASGVHAADEYGAGATHTHTNVTALGSLRKYSSEYNCGQNYNWLQADTCSKSFTVINGETSCSTQAGTNCISWFRAAVTPTHSGGSASVVPTQVSPCASGDCQGDPGCSPFRECCW